MAGEPKRRHSIARKGKRRASIKFAIPNAVVCPNCKSMMLPHTVCKNCGYYRGKELLGKKSEKTEEKTA